MSRPVRVGLVGLIAAGYSGVSRYAASLLTALDGIVAEQPALDFELITTERAAAHDVGPSLGRRRWRHAYKRFVHPWALRHAEAAVAVSHFARDEAIRLLSADDARIHVIHSGPGLALGAPAANGTGQGDYLLY